MQPLKISSCIIAAIDKALLWHPSHTGPKYDEVRKECIAMVTETKPEELPAVSRASHCS